MILLCPKDASPSTTDLSSVFTDVDGDNLTLTASSSDTSVVTVAVSGTNLTSTFVANASGTSTITVTADDGNATVSTTFVITVSAVNDAPTVANAISDFTVSERCKSLNN